MKVFLVQCKGEANRNMTERAEYFRAKDGRGLRNAIKSTFNVPTSTYYGYVYISVREVKMKDLPEILTITIHDKYKSKQKKCKLGKKIVNKIDSVRDGHSCERHYTCKSCGHVHVRKSWK